MSETILVSRKETAFETLRDRHRHESKILFVLLDEFEAPTPSTAHGSLAALSLFREADAQRQYRFFWEQPSKDLAVAASGCMTRVAPDGESVRAFLNLLETDAPLDSRMPLLVGGFAFEPEATLRPAAGFVLPEQMLVAHGASIKTMTAQWVSPEDDLDRRLDTALQASNQLRATALATPAVQPRPGPAEGVRQASSMSRGSLSQCRRACSGGHSQRRGRKGGAFPKCGRRASDPLLASPQSLGDCATNIRWLRFLRSEKTARYFWGQRQNPLSH